MASTDERGRGWMRRGLGALGCGLLLLGCNKEDAGGVGGKEQNLGRSEADWVSKGPKVITTTPGLSPTQIFPATGAVERFVLDPSNPTGAFAASVNGGVWKTADFTVGTSPPSLATWTPLTDRLPSLSISDLAVDPQNSQHVVAGTGCISSSGGFCSHEGLIYQSQDGGDTWGIIHEANLFGRKIQAVTVDGSMILAATGWSGGTSGQIFQSNAGGGFNDLTGAAGLPANLGPVFDLIPDTTAGAYYAVVGGNNGTGGVYRGVFTSASSTWAWTRVSNGDVGAQNLNFVLDQQPSNARLSVSPTGRLFVVAAVQGQIVRVAHTNDFGVSWTTMDDASYTNFWSAPSPTGPVPFTSIDRVAGTADIVLKHTANFVDPSGNKTLGGNENVTLVGVPLFGGKDINGVWRIQQKDDDELILLNRYTLATGNGDTTAASVTTGTWAAWQSPNAGGQGGIHLAIAADPADPNAVFIAGDAGPIFIARGTLNGTTGQVPSQQWTSLATSSSGTVAHVDVRDLVFTQIGGSKALVAATDGGLYSFDTPDLPLSGTWSTIGAGLVTAEMYTVAMDPVSGALLGGLQDNGTPASDDITGGTVSQAWVLLSGADGQGAAAVNANRVDGTGAAVSYRYTNWQGENDFHLWVRNASGQPAAFDLNGDGTTEDNLRLPLKAGTKPDGMGGTVDVPAWELDNLEWNQTVTTNPFEPERLLIGGAGEITGGVQTGGVWESFDHGLNAAVIAGSPIGATHIDAGAPGNHDALWIAAPSGLFSRLSAGAVAPDPTFPVTPRAVAMVPANPQFAYVTGTDNRVYTNVSGAWVDITGDLDDFRDYRAGQIVSQAPATLKDIEYVTNATTGDRVIISAANQYVGVYMMAVDQEETWMRINGYLGGPQEIPYVPVHSIDYEPITDTLAVGTAGRGAWIVDDVSELNRAPVAMCKDIEVAANASCQAYASGYEFNDGSYDPDSTDPLFYYVYTFPDLINTSAGPFDLGPHPITIQVSDNKGAAALCGPVELLVEDQTPPTLADAVPINITTCSGAETIPLTAPTATDNCGMNLVVTGQVISQNGVPLVPPIPVVGGEVTLGPGTWVVEWTADDQANPPVHENQTITIGTAIVASNTYYVRDRGSVEDTLGNPAAVLNSGTGITSIGGDTATVGAIIAGGNVTVAWNGYVYGDITVVGSATVNDPSKHFGNIIDVSSISLPAPPALPTFPPTPPNSDKWINPGTTLNLAPGSYGQVGVNGNPNPNQAAVLRLSAGDYFFTNLYFNSAGLVVVAAPGTRIFASGNVSYNTPIVTAVGSTTLAPVVLGVSGSGSLPLYAPFAGTVIAPNRDLVVGTANGMIYRGSFYARGIDVTPGSTLVCDPSLNAPLPATCSNSVLDAGETDIDCGGPVCGDCANGLDCSVNGDCVSGLCQAGVCQAPIPACNAATYQSESMFHSTGNAWWQGGWNIYSNGYISTPHNFAARPATLTVRALGQAANGLPHMTVSVGGVLAVPTAGVSVTSGAFNNYVFTFNPAGGSQEVRITYDNDYNGPLGDRNLIIDQIAISCP